MFYVLGDVLDVNSFRFSAGLPFNGFDVGFKKKIPTLYPGIILIPETINAQNFKAVQYRLGSFLSFVKDKKITWWKGLFFGFDGVEKAGFNSFSSVSSVKSFKAVFLSLKEFDSLPKEGLTDYINSDIKENNSLYLTLQV